MKNKQIVGVEGIVAKRNKTPYILLFDNDRQMAQLTIAQARNFAHDILNMCSRTEADAMIFKFFEKHNLPEGAAGEVMMDFRIFRYELDNEVVETTETIPSGDIVDFTKKKVQ